MPQLNKYKKVKKMVARVLIGGFYATVILNRFTNLIKNQDEDVSENISKYGDPVAVLGTLVGVTQGLLVCCKSIVDAVSRRNRSNHNEDIERGGTRTAHLEHPNIPEDMVQNTMRPPSFKIQIDTDSNGNI